MKTPNTLAELDVLQPSYVGELVSVNGALYISSGLIPGSWRLVAGAVEGVSSLADLRNAVNGQFGVRLQSAGDDASFAGTHVILQTSGATPANPFVVEIDQFILAPFDGSGQFDLVECGVSADDYAVLFDCVTTSGLYTMTSLEDRFTEGMVGAHVMCIGVPPGTTVDSYQNPRRVSLSARATVDSPEGGSDCCIVDGTDPTVIATAGGITALSERAVDGWSRLVKIITEDKAYRVVFVPGDSAGDGVYSIRARGINS